MQVTEINAEGLKREYRISVPAADIEDKLVARLNEVGQTARVPGFRAGKIPLKILRSRFGEAVRGEVLQTTIDDATSSAIDDAGVRPAMQPEIDIVSFEEGEDLEYTLALELLPEIEPPDFGAYELERLVVEAEAEKVDEAVSRLAAENRQFSPVAEGVAAGDGDQVKIDFDATLDGEPFEGGSARDFVLQLGSGQFVPGFEEQLVGAKAGENKSFEVDFPEEYPNDDLKGRAVVFAVEVKEVLAPDEVAIDDAFAERLGMETLETLRETVKTRMESEYERLSRERLKRSLLDKLAAAHSFDVPPGLVAREFDSIWSEVESAREKEQLDEEDKALDEDGLRERYRGIAERRVRLALLLSEVGRLNNIKVSEEEVTRAMMEQARMFPREEERVFEFYRNNPQAVQSLQAPIFEDKVVDFIIEMAQVSDRTVGVEELTVEQEEASSSPPAPA